MDYEKSQLIFFQLMKFINIPFIYLFIHWNKEVSKTLRHTNHLYVVNKFIPSFNSNDPEMFLRFKADLLIAYTRFACVFLIAFNLSVSVSMYFVSNFPYLYDIWFYFGKSSCSNIQCYSVVISVFYFGLRVSCQKYSLFFRMKNVFFF